jgi:hypothetical protein
MKLTDDELKELPDEQRKAVEAGDAIAVKVYKAPFSGRLFAISLAFTVTAMALPYWVPVSLLMYNLMGIGCLAWMYLARLTSRQYAQEKTMGNVDREVLIYLNNALQKELSKHTVTDGELSDD